MKRIFLVLGMLMLAGMGGCGSNSTAGAQQAASEAALAACNAVTAGIEFVNGAQRQLQARTPPSSLTAAQIATFQEVRRDVTPLCTAGTPAAGAAATILTQFARLTTITVAAQTATTGAR